MYENDNNILCIGTSHGLMKYNLYTGASTLYLHDVNNINSLSDNLVRFIYQDSSGFLWLATNYGLDKFNPVTESFTNYYYDPNNKDSISSSVIETILEDHDGNLWVGTNNGLNKYTPETGIFTHYFLDNNNSNSISSNAITYIYEDSKNTLWIGTTYGLNRFDRDTGNFTHYTTEDGLRNNRINGILEDNDGNLWLGTYGGLSKFNPYTELFINYSKSDGIQGNEFNQGSCYKNEEGVMFFGGLNGLTSFNPTKIETNTNIPVIVITDFLVNGNRISTNESIEDIDEITLPYSNNTFIIDFAALDYASTMDNKYAYMLEGFDDNWIYCDADKSFSRYTNVTSGEYIFKVKASNSDGIWSEEGISLTIVIETPFWKEWWFILLLIIAGILIILLFFKYKTHSLHKRAQELECQVEKRTNLLKLKSDQLENELNKRTEFSRFLVHELKTPLTSLQLTNDVLMANAQSQPFIYLSEGINKDISSLSHRIEELLDISRGEIGLLKLKRREVYLNKFFLMLKKDLTLLVESEGKILEFSIPDGLPTILIDKERIVQVIYNLVDNALKYTYRNGIIIISVDVLNNNLIVKVSDNGSGISNDKLHTIFEDSHHQTEVDKRHGGFGLGLSLSKLLIELHGGNIWVDSELNKGSTFGFSIPING
jgi:signal transduction histidine kinase/streptogramin lyase